MDPREALILAVLMTFELVLGVLTIGAIMAWGAHDLVFPKATPELIAVQEWLAAHTGWFYEWKVTILITQAIWRVINVFYALLEGA